MSARAAVDLTSSGPRFRAVAASLAAAGAVAGAALMGAPHDSAIALTIAQTAGVLWLLYLGSGGPRAWATAAFTTGAAWVPLFLLPCWVYSVDPGLLRTTRTPEQPIAITTLSLFALIAGLLLAGRGGREPRPRLLVSVVQAPVRGRALLVWGVVGLASLGMLMALNGGPVSYVSNLDKSGQLNRGLFALVWGVLFLRLAPLSAIAARWAAGKPAGLLLVAGFVAGSLIVVVTGARGFLAVAAVQILLQFVLLRRPLPLRQVILPTLVVAFLIVFGVGSLKRFQAYRQTHPTERITLPGYLVGVAPREAVDAYVNNYVDGVALIGTARRIVPAHADYEYGKALARLAFKVVPRSLRPSVSEAPAIRRELEPPGGYVYAVPLQAVAYMQFGIPGVIVAFLLVGSLVAVVDRRLRRPGPERLPVFLALVALVVQIPMLLRSGIPAGAVFLLVEVVGMWIAAATVTGQARAELRALRRVLSRL